MVNVRTWTWSRSEPHLPGEGRLCPAEGLVGDLRVGCGRLSKRPEVLMTGWAWLPLVAPLGMLT